MQRRNARWNPLTMVGTLVVGLAGLTSGCATIQGRWAGDELSPEMARDQFKLLRPASAPGRFVSADIRFQQDDTYTAQVNYDGKLQQYQGKYDYKEGKVTFVDGKGNNWIYAVKRPDDTTLQLITGIKGTDVRLTLKKQP